VKEPDQSLNHVEEVQDELPKGNIETKDVTTNQTVEEQATIEGEGNNDKVEGACSDTPVQEIVKNQVIESEVIESEVIKSEVTKSQVTESEVIESVATDSDIIESTENTELMSNLAGKLEETEVEKINKPV